MEVFRPTGVLKRFTELRHSKVKYKHIFYNASSTPSPSPLLKLPNNLFNTVKAARKRPLQKSEAGEVGSTGPRSELGTQERPEGICA